MVKSVIFVYDESVFNLYKKAKISFPGFNDIYIDPTRLGDKAKNGNLRKTVLADDIEISNSSQYTDPGINIACAMMFSHQVMISIPKANLETTNENVDSELKVIQTFLLIF